MIKIFFITLIIIVFLGGSFIAWKGLSKNPKRVPSVLINTHIPKISLPTLALSGSASKEFFTQKDLGNQVVLINFWASWCLVCVAEHKVLKKIKNIIPIYGIAYKDSGPSAKAWLKIHGNVYKRIGLDSDGSVAISFGLYGVPESYLIDKHHIIRYKIIGEITDKILTQTLLPLIKKLQKET